MVFTIPELELRVRAVRAGGPGGQHVNKTSTKVEVLWDIEQSAALSQAQKSRLHVRLANRIDASGTLRVTAGARRSQLQNREAAIRRMNELVQQALVVPKPRKKTKPSRQAREKRIAEKKQRSQTKQRRRPVEPDGES